MNALLTLQQHLYYKRLSNNEDISIQTAMRQVANAAKMEKWSIQKTKTETRIRTPQTQSIVIDVSSDEETEVNAATRQHTKIDFVWLQIRDWHGETGWVKQRQGVDGPRIPWELYAAMRWSQCIIKYNNEKTIKEMCNLITMGPYFEQCFFVKE